VLETLELGDLCPFNILLQLLNSALVTETVQAVELDRGLISFRDGFSVFYDWVGVADRAVGHLFFNRVLLHLLLDFLAGLRHPLLEGGNQGLA